MQVEFVHAVAVGTIVDMPSVHLESLSVLCSLGPGTLGSTSIPARSQSCMLSCKWAETEYGISSVAHSQADARDSARLQVQRDFPRCLELRSLRSFGQ